MAVLVSYLSCNTSFEPSTVFPFILYYSLLMDYAYYHVMRYAASDCQMHQSYNYIYTYGLSDVSTLSFIFLVEAKTIGGKTYVF